MKVSIFFTGVYFPTKKVQLTHVNKQIKNLKTDGVNETVQHIKALAAKENHLSYS